MRRFGGLGAVAVAVALLVSGCGSGAEDGAAASSTAPRTDPSGSGACEGAPRPGVALDPAAKACADNGFEPRADVFAFANWGGPGSLDAAGMVAMFGPEAVCAQQADGGCVLFPGAQAWLDQVNQAMAGGRCEGMAVVAARLEEGGSQVASLQDGAEVTADLKQETQPVVDEIEYWWATQMVAEVAGPTAEVRAMQPAEVVATLVQGLRAGTGYTLGMYANGSGHAVTPFAVSQSPDGSFDIAIYDNNDPAAVSHVIVDPATQTWRYDQAAINPSAEATAWTGSGPGTLDLTAMDWRTGPFAAPFADPAGESATEGSRTFLVTAGIGPGEGSVGAQVSAGGVTIDTTSDLDQVDALPPGVVVTPIKAQARGRGTVVGVQVSVPAGIDSISVSPRVVRGAGPQPSGGQARAILAQVSVDGPGQPRVTAFGEAAEEDAAFTVTAGAAGSTQVQASAGARVLMAVASGRRSLTIPVPGGGQARIVEGANRVADIAVESQDGEQIDLTLDGSDEGEVLNVVATFEDGEWVIEEWSDEDSAPWEDEEWYDDISAGGAWSEDAWSEDSWNDDLWEEDSWNDDSWNDGSWNDGSWNEDSWSDDGSGQGESGDTESGESDDADSGDDSGEDGSGADGSDGSEPEDSSDSPDDSGGDSRGDSETDAAGGDADTGGSGGDDGGGGEE